MYTRKCKMINHSNMACLETNKKDAISVRSLLINSNKNANSFRPQRYRLLLELSPRTILNPCAYDICEMDVRVVKLPFWLGTISVKTSHQTSTDNWRKFIPKHWAMMIAPCRLKLLSQNDSLVWTAPSRTNARIWQLRNYFGIYEWALLFYT